MTSIVIHPLVSSRAVHHTVLWFQLYLYKISCPILYSCFHCCLHNSWQACETHLKVHSPRLKLLQAEFQEHGIKF